MLLFPLFLFSLFECLHFVEPLINDFNGDFFAGQNTVGHRHNIPQLKLVDIETYCFGNLEFMQLGPCSSTFLKCDRFTQQRQYHLEECPLGEIFQNTRCRPAYEVKDCFNTEANLLSDATEKLAKATNFCARNSLGTALYSSAESNGPNHKCSRQALLCRHIGEPLAISCPSEKVLEMQTLRCVEAPEACFFVSSGDFAPVRENILHSYCALKFPESQMGAPNNENEGSVLTSQFASTESRENSHCQNWYVACLAPTVEFVFCEDGKLFDYRRRTCRRATVEDQCPHISTCKGWEWRTVSLAECRSDFLFCNGLRPTIFQCQVKGAVFMDGECVVPGKFTNKCTVCQLGERKKAEKCSEFFFCEEHELTGNPHWQSFRCEAPRVFSPFTKECVSPSEYSCPNKIDCREGESFSVNCGNFFYCYEGKYKSGKCPHLTRWDAKQRRCISDTTCRRFKDDKNENTCQSGEVRLSVDCESFDECVDGKFIKMSCHGVYKNVLSSFDRMKGFLLNPAVGVCDWPRNVPGC